MTLPGGASGTGSKTRSQSGSTRMYVSAYSGNGRPGAVPATGPALAYAWTGCREPPLRPFVTGAKPRARRCSMTEERPTEWPRSAAVAVSCKATKSDFPQLPGVLSLLRGCPDLTRKGSWMSITFDHCSSAAFRKILGNCPGTPWRAQVGSGNQACGRVGGDSTAFFGTSWPTGLIRGAYLGSNGY